MKIHAECIPCLMDARLSNIREIGDETKRFEYMRGLCDIGIKADPERDTAPMIGRRMLALQRNFYGVGDDFKFIAIRREYNQLLLGLYDDLKARVFAAPDPLDLALRYALAGNYIDMGVLKDVRKEELIRLLEEAATKPLDPVEYANFARDLAGDGELVVLHDNAGEIVLDKLLIETIRSIYPEKRIASVVRGGPILNDATRDDAREIGLDALSDILDNNLADFGGTELSCLEDETRRRIEGADVILAKGMGNFETMMGCGLNVYYLLLSKCVNYTRWFGFEHFAAILANDRRMEFR